uniref:Photosystem I reaction center subunit Nic n=1 Tax=Rhizophora mucronata TaxID=61149 RepID=A0A2P2KSC6_RHIMU
MPTSRTPVVSGLKSSVIRAQQAEASDSKELLGNGGRRAAVLYLAATLFTSAAAGSSANAGIIDEYLERSKVNKVCLVRKRA